MSDAQPSLIEIGDRIRRARKDAGYRSLDQFADRIRDTGCDRPSVAKLSRIETGDQPVTLDILLALSELTGIDPWDLRPDVAAKFARAEIAE
jgi:transcriptional regulator with XRE-family HTH domain